MNIFWGGEQKFGGRETSRGIFSGGGMELNKIFR